MCKKNLSDCRSGKDFCRYAETHGAEVRGGNGSHQRVSTDRGTTFVPYHNGDMPTGTRCAIIKQLLAIGITVFILVMASGML